VSRTRLSPLDSGDTPLPRQSSTLSFQPLLDKRQPQRLTPIKAAQKASSRGDPQANLVLWGDGFEAIRPLGYTTAAGQQREQGGRLAVQPSTIPEGQSGN